MDKNNPVIALVALGMEIERKKNVKRAQELFMQAWHQSSTEQEKCIAAHFVARHQNTPEEALKWNLESLQRADKVHNEEIKGYYPSLYLNIGASYETLGDKAEAGKYYNLAFERIPDLPRDEENVEYSRGTEKVIVEKRAQILGMVTTG